MHMARITGNRLLLGAVAGVILYWGPGYFLPRPFISSVVSLSLLVFGGLTLAIYAQPAWNVLINQQRDEVERGSHLAILGTFFIAAGLVWSGVYGIAWVLAGQPYGWAGTLTSNFGRVMLGSGMFLTYIAPQTTDAGVDSQVKIWVYCAIAGSFAAGFLLATQISYDTDSARVLAAKHPICPVEQPVWGSSNKKYHLADSPYRDMVKPSKCFSTEEEAIADGYTAAR